MASGTVDAHDGLASTTVVTARGQTPCAVDGVLTDVALKPVTGRRHQLRRHCGETLGAPILGDDLYGGPRKGIGLFLYCRRLAMDHPLAPGRVVCEIDEPRRFARHRAKARKGWDWARDTRGVCVLVVDAGYGRRRLRRDAAGGPGSGDGGGPRCRRRRGAGRRPGLGAELGQLLLDLGHLGVREDLPMGRRPRRAPRRQDARLDAWCGSELREPETTNARATPCAVQPPAQGEHRAARGDALGGFVPIQVLQQHGGVSHGSRAGQP